MSDAGNGLAELLALLKSRVGCRADIRIGAGLYKGHYASLLEHVKEDGSIGLAHPLRKGGLLPVYRDLVFSVYFEHERAPLLVRAVALRSDLSQSLPILWARCFGDFERVQRRRFLRVSCLLRTSFFNLDREEASPLREIWRQGKILDVSLGGARLQYVGERAITKDEHCVFMLPLPEGMFHMIGKVVWLPPSKEPGQHEMGVEFDFLPRLVEKHLREFIRQQELVKR